MLTIRPLRRGIITRAAHTLAMKYGLGLRIHSVVGAQRDATSTGLRHLFSGLCNRTWPLALTVANCAGSDVHRPSRLTKPNSHTAPDSAAGPGHDGDPARHPATTYPKPVPPTLASMSRVRASL